MVGGGRGGEGVLGAESGTMETITGSHKVDT